MTDTARRSGASLGRADAARRRHATAGAPIPAQSRAKGALAVGRRLGASSGATRCSGSRPALILLFVVMAAVPQLFTSTDPNFADLSQRPAGHRRRDAWFGHDTQGYDVYARTIYGARASILVGIFATAVHRGLRLAASASIAGYCGGWVDAVLGRIGEIFFAIPLLLGGILFLYTFPSDARDPVRRRVLKVVLAHRDPRLAEHRPADALERAPGQAERLRPGGPGARRVARSGSSSPTSCPTRWPR